MLEVVPGNSIRRPENSLDKSLIGTLQLFRNKNEQHLIKCTRIVRGICLSLPLSFSKLTLSFTPAQGLNRLHFESLGNSVFTFSCEFGERFHIQT